MLKKTKTRLGVVAVSASLALALGATAPAYADPAAGTYPILAGVGSDTTQDVMNGIASAVTSIGSYDAVGSSTIQTRASGTGSTAFTRPNGSGAGQIALSQAIQGNNYNGVAVSGAIDFARSSSAPDATLGSGGQLTFIPFARDAVTFAVSAASDFPRDIPLGSASQDSATTPPFTLRNIYRSVVTTYVDGDLNTVTINPLIPQSGSGTTKFWASALGLTTSTFGGTVTSNNNGLAVQEHDGTYVTGAGDIVPFSIAQYIAQGNHTAVTSATGVALTERRGNIQLGNIGSVKPYVFTTGGIQLNTSFPVTRLIFNVVSTARLNAATATSASDIALRAAFVGSTSQVCSQSTIIKQFGFATIGSLCGNTSTYTQGYKNS